MPSSRLAERWRPALAAKFHIVPQALRRCRCLCPRRHLTAFASRQFAPDRKKLLGTRDQESNMRIPNQAKQSTRARSGGEETIPDSQQQSGVPLRDRRDAPPHTPPIRLICLQEVLAMCGKSRSSVYELIKKGEFPAPVKLRGRSSAWVDREILQWLQDCVRARESP